MAALIKVLIAAGEGAFRVGLVHILESDPSITVVCEAGDGGEALDRAAELRPHVILIDVPQIRDDAFEAVLRIRDAVPATSIILMSDSQAQEDISRALACGALGYLLRGSSSVEIIQAVKAAASGRVVLSPGIAAVLAARLSDRAKEPRLSRRETEILKLLGEDLSNREIAHRLTINTSTVRTYIYRILDKLNLRNRMEATAYAGHLYGSYARFDTERGQIITDIISPKQIEHLRAPSAEATPGRAGEPVWAAGPAESAADIPGGAITGERKLATALSVELALYTDAARPVESESAEEVLRNSLDAVAGVVRRYGGITAWLSTQGLTAFFGVPLSQEHAPQKALHTSLAILESVQEYNGQRHKRGIRINARVGINTGTLLMLKLADTSEARYIPVAGTARLAENLRDVAEPGNIVVADSTYRLTRDQYMFEPAGAVSTSAAGEAVSIYRLLGHRPLQSKLDAVAMRGLSDFVGRRTEIESLKEAFERAKEGAGQVIGIVGDAGAGKSRLVLEMRRALLVEQCRYLEGGCISYDGAAPYLPILDILKSYFDIQGGESESVIKDKMRDRVTGLDDRLGRVLAPLQDILSLTVDDEDYIKLEPRQKREKLFEAVRDLLIRESQNKPLIIAIEDLLWIDSGTEEFLSYFMGWMANAHILLILLYRPEYVHGWASRSCYGQIRVGELIAETSAQLVRSILRDGEVAPGVTEIVIGRAGGNPLFIEELTRDLLDSGAIMKERRQYVLGRNVWDIHVPDTVQGIVAARMDRLEGSLKRTLQVASVVGRYFNHRVLQAVTGMQDELKPCLLNLQDQEFIYEKSLFPELEYVFKHALIQEVAYGSLLLKDRKACHERIGQAMEELYPERLEEVYEVLAHHYFRSDNSEKAYDFLRLSAEKAVRTHSLWEAYRFYKQAIEVLERLPETEANKRRGVEIRIGMSGVFFALLYPEDSLDILQEGERLATEIGDDRDVAAFRASIAQIYSLKGQTRKGLETLEEAFNLAERMPDAELVVKIGWQLCSSHCAVGQFSRVPDVAAKAVSVIETKHRESESFGGLHNLHSGLASIHGFALAHLGDFREGQAQCEKGLRLAVKVGDSNSVGMAELTLGMLFYLQGDGRNAVEHLRNAVKYCDWAQNVMVGLTAQGYLGGAYILAGQPETACQQLEDALRHAKLAGAPVQLTIVYRGLVSAYFEAGDLEAALRCSVEAVGIAVEGTVAEQVARIWHGRILSRCDASRADEAEKHIRQGIGILDEYRTRPYSSQGRLFLGELYADTGQKDKALEALGKAEAEFKDMGMDYWLGKTQEVLARIQQ